MNMSLGFAKTVSLHVASYIFLVKAFGQILISKAKSKNGIDFYNVCIKSKKFEALMQICNTKFKNKLLMIVFFLQIYDKI